MAIRSSLYFTFNNIKSTDFGIINVNVSSGGLLEEPFVASRSINEVKIRGRDKSYFSGISNSPLSFTLSFAFQDPFDSDNIRAVARWLFMDFYKPLQFSDNLDRVYYGIVEGNSSILHNGAGSGYINLNIRCDSPYSYSPYYTKEFDLSSNPVGGTIISLDNRGDLRMPVELTINKVGNGEFEIRNLSNSGVSSKFSYILPNPTVAPILSQVSNAGSTLPAVKYYVRYTWIGVSGETNVSSEVSFTIVSSGFNLVVTIPALPSGASFGAFYIGTSAGSGTKQGTSTTTTFTLSAPLVVGASAPTSNTTGLLNGETVFINSDSEIIISDLIPVTYRYQNFSDEYLELVFGVNSLLVIGTAKVGCKFSYVYLQG